MATRTQVQDAEDVRIDRSLVLEKYEVGSRIGTGGYGQVHFLQEKRSAQTVRVGKFILKSKVQKWFPPGKPNPLPLEVHICLNMANRNVMKCVDYVDIDRNWFLMVMHDHNGTDLFDFIEKNDVVDEKLSHKIFSQLMGAVRYLCNKGIIHRDIKDENVLIDEHHNIILIDFGSAMQVYGDVEDVISPRFCGTVKYCPPEAVTNEKFRAMPGEIWAMGVLLYTVLHGGNPFYDVQEILHSRLEFDEHLSPFVQDVLCGLLNRDARRRYSLRDIERHEWVKTGPK